MNDLVPSWWEYDNERSPQSTWRRLKSQYMSELRDINGRTGPSTEEKAGMMISEAYKMMDSGKKIITAQRHHLSAFYVGGEGF